MTKVAAPRRIYVVDGMTKQDIHDQLVTIVKTAAENYNSMRNIFVAKMGTVDALRGSEADRIVRRLVESDSAYEWPQYKRFFKERGMLDYFEEVIRVYRKMSWKRGARSGPRIGAVA